MRRFPHTGLAMGPPFVTRLAHVLALGFRGQQIFLNDKPAFKSARDNEAGCAVTALSAINLAASSGIVMSGSASTHLSRSARCGASLPPPGGRPCRAGSAEPVRDTRSASFTAKLALTS
jgi:hypothetical protein